MAGAAWQSAAHRPAGTSEPDDRPDRPRPLLRAARVRATAAGPPARSPRTPARCPDDHAAAGRPSSVSLRPPPPLDVPMTSSPAATTGGDGAPSTAPVIATARAAPTTRSTDVEPVDARRGARRPRRRTPASPSTPSRPASPAAPAASEGDGLRIFPGRVADARPDEEPRASPRRGPPTAPSPRTSTPTSTSTARASAGHLGRAGLRRRLGRRPRGAADGAGPDDRAARLAAGDRRGARAWSARAAGSEGRKTLTASTLYDADGRVVASAEHLWIAVDPRGDVPRIDPSHGSPEGAWPI